jgi:hypothetical protein
VAIYSIADVATPGGNGSCLWEVRTTSTDRAALVEIGMGNAVDITPSASIFKLGRPAARGVTPTTPLTVLAEDENGPAGTVQTAQAWTTAPTAPANFFRIFRNFHFNMVDWVFPAGLLMAVSASFVLWTSTGGTATAHQVFAAVDE